MGGNETKKRFTFEVTEINGNSTFRYFEDVEHVVRQTNGIAVVMKSKEIVCFTKVSMLLFLFTVQHLELFCEIRSGTAVNIKEVKHINRLDCSITLNSNEVFTYSTAGFRQYLLMLNPVKWIKPAQTELKFQ